MPRFPEQPSIIHALVNIFLTAFSISQRYLCLPRMKPRLLIPDDFDAGFPKDGSLPRMHPTW